MDPLSPLSPTLRIDKLDLFRGDKQQPPPFSRGQVLQGLITGKNNNQFTLEVDGQQFVADSKAPLRVGQRLELQVTGLSPRITLQILSDPLTNNIGKSLYLLPTEGRLIPQLSALVANLPADSLKPASLQTIDFFSSLATSGSGVTTDLSGQPGEQLARLLSGLFTPGNAISQNEALSRLSTLLDRLAQSLPRQDHNSPLLQLIQRELSVLDQNLPVREFFFRSAEPEGITQLDVMLRNISQLPAAENIGRTLAEAILPLIRGNDALSPTPLLLQLLNLTGDLLRQESTAEKPALSGRELEQFVNRLGTNFEQLLATGRQEEALQTLKSALLDISHALTGNAKGQQVAEQLTSTIQLYQMLQIRLANEALLFLPLPLPFLNQGFLLVSPDDKQHGLQTRSEEQKKKYTLHLNLAGLGNLQIEFQQLAGGMRLRFYSEDNSKAKFLAEHREELPSWLTATDLESVQFLTGAEDPAKKLLSLMTHGSTGVLNTRA